VSDVAFWDKVADPALEPFKAALRAEWERRGYEFVEGDGRSAACIFNFIDPAGPKPFRRRQRSTYVIAVHALAQAPDDVFKYAYPMLVRALANIAMLVVPGDACYFVTPEQGFYSVPDPGDPGRWAHDLFERIEPLATSRLVIDNRFDTDLEPELWDGDEQTEALFQAGRRLDALGLLPAPFPLDDLLTEDDRRWVKLVYGIGGLSYGNLSARKDALRFWMSASGVDKSNLREIGRDILMVKDYDAEAGRMLLSVPPGVEPRRASVDAIEHFMIYREHPEVGAIVHVHAWIPGVEATQFNYPCGTAELATAVSDIIRVAPEPGRAVVGLKNHGLTITGPNLGDIFSRIEPVIETQIPMIA
jgi:Class II Aldolase and Adducin N-terminal domain